MRACSRLFEYIGNHPYLAAAAVTAAIVVLVYELRARVQAFAALSAMQAVRLMNQGALVIDLRAKERTTPGISAMRATCLSPELESQAESLKKWRERT